MKVNAQPTKEFFIDMLTRDIPLNRAILDLIDNSIDAARANNIKDAVVRVRFNEEVFEITDNCGGLNIDDARSYAFRFGRVEGERVTPSSIGQFGVGMKRALFKIGKEFTVTSSFQKRSFEVNVDVDQWKKIEDWFFDFEEIALNDDGSESGTKIRVNNLYEEISDQFALDQFENSLGIETSLAHFSAINSGVKILINSKSVESNKIKFKSSDELSVYKKEFELGGVKVKILAGVSERDLDKGGWYIVCNGRLVEAAEKTKVTGWQTGDGIPKYHPDYAFFRGVIFFECDDSSKLPWTTTKTGVDSGSRVYRAALNEMRVAMRPIIGFLKERSKEDADVSRGLLDSDDNPLNRAINQSRLKDVSEFSNFSVSSNFTHPEKAERKQAPATASVQYQVKIKDLEIVKDSLGVSTNKEVGEFTFNYYMDNEC